MSKPIIRPTIAKAIPMNKIGLWLRLGGIETANGAAALL